MVFWEWRIEYGFLFLFSFIDHCDAVAGLYSSELRQLVFFFGAPFKVDGSFFFFWIRISESVQIWILRTSKQSLILFYFLLLFISLLFFQIK